MEFMKNIIFTACILSVVITISGNIKSGEKFSKQLNIIFSLVFSAGIVTAAVRTGLDFEIPDFENIQENFEYSELESNAQSALKTEIEARTNCIIEDLLRKNNISFEKISTDINIEEDGSISIYRIDYKGDDFERAKRLTEENFMDAEVNRIE